MKHKRLSKLISLALAGVMTMTSTSLTLAEDHKADKDSEIILSQDYDTSPQAVTADVEQEVITKDGDAKLNTYATEYYYEDLTYTISNNRITITDCNTDVTSVTIPDNIDGMKVTAIDDCAFEDCARLTSLTIPEGITSLGYYIISGTAITSITIPSTVTSSGDTSANGALAGATQLKEVRFAEGTESIPAYICASDDNTSYIETVYIPDGVKTIGSYAFYNNDNINSIILPDSVTAINSYAFYDCNNLVSVTMPANLETIGSSAFQYCGSLTSIDIPKKVTSVGSYAFENTGLRSVTFNYNDSIDNECSIGGSAFASNIYLTSVTLAETVTSIGNYAFDDCYNLKSLTLPEGVESLGYYFIRGTAISSITIPSTVTSSGDTSANGALAGAEELKEVRFAEDTESIPAYICASDDNISYIETVYIPDGVKTIGSYAFYNNDNINSIILPDSVTTINGYAFYSCNNLASVTMPANLETIGSSAFQYCELLTSMNIPKKVTSVGSYAFADSGLTSVTFNYNDSIDNECSINSYAFSGCTNLTDVTLASTVTSIGNYAFYDCNNLKELILPEGVKSLGYYIIGRTIIESITIPSTVTNSGDTSVNGALAGATKLTEVRFAEGTENIPAYICASDDNTSYIETVYIPEGVKTIGSYAFYNNDNMSSIILPDSVTTINGYAFYDCDNLASVTMPANLKTIGSSAFQYCESLISIDIPKGVTSVGSYAFANSGLTSVTFNNNTELEFSCEINSYAFSGCTNLVNVSLVPSVTFIGDYAFYDCNSLKELVLPEGVETLGYYMIARTIIESITIPSTVTRSGSTSNNGALAGATKLTEVRFAYGTQRIPAYICASDDQTSYIERVYIPPTVVEIGDYAFYNCTAMTIYCEDGSVAHQYALANSIPYVLIEFEDTTQATTEPTTQATMESTTETTTQSTTESTTLATTTETTTQSTTESTTLTTTTESTTETTTYTTTVETTTVTTSESTTEVTTDLSTESTTDVIVIDEDTIIAQPVARDAVSAYGFNIVSGEIGSTFDVDFNISNVENTDGIVSYTFFITYDPDVVRMVGVKEPDSLDGYMTYQTHIGNTYIDNLYYDVGDIMRSIEMVPGVEEENYRDYSDVLIDESDRSLTCAELGKVKFAYYATNPSDGTVAKVFNSGTLFTLKFEIVGSGDSRIAIDLDYPTVDGIRCWEDHKQAALDSNIIISNNVETTTESTTETTTEFTTSEDIIAGGNCGDDLTWTLSKDGVLTISGLGEMYEWEDINLAPWFSYNNQIVNVVIEYGVTNITNNSFTNYDITNVSIPDSVINIGTNTFNNNNNITINCTDNSYSSTYVQENNINYINIGYFGDVTADGKLTASDASNVLQKVLDASFSLAYEKNCSDDFMSIADVTADDKLTASDASTTLQKVLDASFEMPCEKQ